MRILLLMPAVLVLAACTTTKSLQEECAQMHEHFVDEVSCFSQKLEAQPSLKGDSFANEYVLAGQVLARRVEEGQLQEDEARLAFSRKYNELLLKQQQYNTLSAFELDTLSPRYRHCGGRDYIRGHGHCR